MQRYGSCDGRPPLQAMNKDVEEYGMAGDQTASKTADSRAAAQITRKRMPRGW